MLNPSGSLAERPERRTADRCACPLCGADAPANMYTCFSDFRVVRCTACRFIYTTLPVNKEVLQEMYAESYYHTDSREQYYFENVITAETVRAENSNIRDFRHGLDEIEKYCAGGKLLDVGCAIGVFLAMAKHRGWDVVGVDVSPFASSYAREKLGVNAIAGELEDAGFPDRHFDVITLWDVIEHFPDPIATLREIRRILKDDGVLFVNTPNEQSLLKVLARFFYLASAGRFTYPVHKMYHEWHLSYFTAQSLTTVLARSGFKLEVMKRKCISLMKARGGPCERAVVEVLSWPERLLGRETELIAIARKTELVSPFPGTATDD